MKKINSFLWRGFLVLGLVFVLVSFARSLPSDQTHKSAHADMPLQHIIFIVKENHTFDSYFGAFPGANGATTGQVLINGQPQTIPLNPGQNVPAPFCHTFSCANKEDNKGAMDAFNVADAKNCGTAPYACYQMGTDPLIPNYWTLAQNYVLDDNAWSSLRGPSFPNHLYTMAGASGPDAQDSVIGNPKGSTWGCDANSGASVPLLNKTRVFPCFTFPAPGLVERVRKMYEESLQRVLPMKERLQKTDALIDAVVYRLYGLTEEEIGVVEGKG